MLAVEWNSTQLIRRLIQENESFRSHWQKFLSKLSDPQATKLRSAVLATLQYKRPGFLHLFLQEGCDMRTLYANALYYFTEGGQNGMVTNEKITLQFLNPLHSQMEPLLPGDLVSALPNLLASSSVFCTCSVESPCTRSQTMSRASLVSQRNPSGTPGTWSPCPPLPMPGVCFCCMPQHRAKKTKP